MLQLEHAGFERAGLIRNNNSNAFIFITYYIVFVLDSHNLVVIKPPGPCRAYSRISVVNKKIDVDCVVIFILLLA